ncbi:tetratricopeptide repeat protein [Rhodopseudomonas palustris]|nr:tetratricopeptide repeat protein [Rhodopseudomonas palustris]
MWARSNCYSKVLSRSISTLAAIASVLLLANPAFSQGQALERCRETVGRPIVMPCMKAGGTLESCRALATPKVRACVQAAMGGGMGGGPGGAGRQGPGGLNQPRSVAGPAVGKARSLIEQGKYAGAIVELDRAVKQDPKFPFAYAWRGVAKMRIGKFDEAMSDFNEALKLDPRNAFALGQRGNAFFALRDNGKGLADVNAALEIDNTAAAPYAFRGMIYSDMGDQDKALADLTRAVKLNPNLPPAHGGLGSVYSKLQEFEKSLAAYNRALELAPNTAAYLSGRGYVHFSLGEYDRAITDISQAIAINSRFARPYINRGRAYIATNNLSAAIKDFDEALKIEPKNITALLQRAQAFERSRDFAKAQADLQDALKLVPSHPVAAAGIERIDAKMGATRPGTERTGGRIALVIGNSKYEAFDTLANPKRDAAAIADALGRSGFQNVKLLTDVNRDSLLAALKTFTDESKNANWSVVYFAGHGIELDGSNYLVPVDAKFENDANIPNEGVALDQVLNAVGAADKMRLVILDACRENPFAAEKKSLSVGRGLARIEPESGTLVAFATKHGHYATDGSGDNSPFATSLVRLMDAPGLEINQLFRMVHDDVYASTAKKQEPFTYGQLSAQGFYFKAR